jgi:hypothetical protein
MVILTKEKHMSNYKVSSLGGGQATIVTGDIEQYQKDQDAQLAYQMKKFWEGPSHKFMSVDLATLGCEKLWTGQEKTIFGKKIWPILYDTQGRVGEAIAKHSGKAPFLSMIQVWNGSKNIMMGFTEADIKDAGFNWRKEDLLPQDDLLNRSLSACVLKGDPLLFYVIKAQVYTKHAEKQGVKASILHRIWD